MASKGSLTGTAELFGATLEAPELPTATAAKRQVCLTVLHHPDFARIGEECFVGVPGRGGERKLSRTEPEFVHPRADRRSWPLADPFVSRRPALLRSAADGSVEVERPNDASLQIVANGEPLETRRTFSAAQVERGVVLHAGRRVVLLLHMRRPRAEPPPAELGFVGDSEPIDELRAAIQRVADLDVPVLLTGQTGTGKELAARAIHMASARAAKAWLGVNMGALAPTVAASELFGHTKGAFTGATADHPGYFARADGSTLFLDEIGETPSEVQVMLLRVLETAIIQRVGDRAEQHVDVRLVAATDADLEAAVREGSFRAALLHRLSGYDIRVPTLDERRPDLGRLAHHFLAAELATTGERARIEETKPSPHPWLPSNVAERLSLYDWPGNVRQFRNAVRQLVISNRGRDVVRLDAALERMLADTCAEVDEVPPAVVSTEPSERRKPSEVTEDELVEALRTNRWRLAQTARQLRISPASLHMLIDKSERVQKAKDIDEAELLRCYNELGGDLDAMADRLEVSRRGLNLRLKEIL